MPVTRAISAIVAEADREIGDVTVTAPLVEGAGLIAVRWAGLNCCRLSSQRPAISDLPAGVTGFWWSAEPDTVRPLPAMIAPEQSILAAAWAFGAWDVVRTCIGAGYDGMLPPYMGTIAQRVREQGYVTWTWRPMLRGPEVRAKAHGHRDSTLDRLTLGRSGPMPDVRVPPLRPGGQHVLRLGGGAQRRSAPRPTPGAVPPATERQLRAIAALRREAGLASEDLPHLNIRQASAMIEEMRGRPAPRPSRRMTANQYQALTHYLRRIGKSHVDHPEAPPLPIARWLLEVDYMVAQRWIAWAREQL